MNYPRPVTPRERDRLHSEVLSSSHDASFISSDADLTDYLHEVAWDDQVNKTAITHLLFYDHILVGFFTLLNDSIKVNTIEDNDRIHGYVYRSLPAIKIGRLSVHRDHEKKGYGSEMLSLSLSYLFEVVKYSGCRIVTVDSKKGCEGFHSHFGFKMVKGRKDNYCPIWT